MPTLLGSPASPRALAPRPLPAGALGRFLKAAHAFSIGDWDAVREGCARVLDLSPGHAQTLRLLARVHEQHQDWSGALPLLSGAVHAEPSDATWLNDLGCCLERLKRYADALECFERALALAPADPAALSNRGAVLGALGRTEEALASLRQALALDPGRAATLLNLANILRCARRASEGLEVSGRLVALAPGRDDAWIVRACCLRALGRNAEALDDLARAAAIAPDRPEIHRDRAYTLLELGRWEEGWPLTEWRWHVPDGRLVARRWDRPQWRGEPVAGKTVLLHNEQGLGDAIMLARLATAVAERGARVLLEVQDSLIGLLSQVEGVRQTLPFGSRHPPHDLHCPLFSLPGVLGLSTSSVPSRSGYLKADSARVQAWRHRLGKATRPRIGIAWSGNPEHSEDAYRSIPLERFVRALPSGEVEVIRLQTSMRDSDAPVLSANSWIRSFDGISDFEDTAALCALVDLVVTVDTSVAHLAGAMGRPTWILLTDPAEYRWMASGDRTPWYDSMELLRQEPGRGWDPLLATLRERLVDWAARP